MKFKPFLIDNAAIIPALGKLTKKAGNTSLRYVHVSVDDTSWEIEATSHYQLAIAYGKFSAPNYSQVGTVDLYLNPEQFKGLKSSQQIRFRCEDGRVVADVSGVYDPIVIEDFDENVRYPDLWRLVNTPPKKQDESTTRMDPNMLSTAIGISKTVCGSKAAVELIHAGGGDPIRVKSSDCCGIHLEQLIMPLRPRFKQQH